MPNPDGRVPQFTTSGSLVWKLLEAALPNIQGELTYRNSTDGTAGLNTVASPKGIYAYKDISETYNRLITTQSNDIDAPNQLVTVDASRSSAIYKGAKSQPSALQILACIRI